jgi:hypothetical protein
MRPPKIDLTGRRFGRVIVLGLSSTRRGHHVDWICRCDCGTEWPVTGPNLRTGDTKSCGCLKIDVATARLTKHGGASARGAHPLYDTWLNMNSRCHNPSNPAYSRYGGRGIAICSRWSDFANFAEDMGSPPAPGMSVDRIDNNGDYSPENCRWADDVEQGNNKRNNRIVDTPRGSMTAAEAARSFGISYAKLRTRLHRGQPVAELFSPRA